MADLETIMEKTIELLKADAALIALVPTAYISIGYTDRFSKVHLPSLAFWNIGEFGDSSGFNDCGDETKKMWWFADIQFDIWSGTPNNRDLILKELKRVLLLGKPTLFADADVLSIQPQNILSLTETDKKPVVFHKAVTYRFFYVEEEAVP